MNLEKLVAIAYAIESLHASKSYCEKLKPPTRKC
jgi:hypothetical protein